MFLNLITNCDAEQSKYNNMPTVFIEIQFFMIVYKTIQVGSIWTKSLEKEII